MRSTISRHTPRRRARRYISGPVLLGFAEAFDASRGDPNTPRPYVTVTPSRLGKTLLPFACPHCEAVSSEAVDPETRSVYLDRDREFSWCPVCRGRYVLQLSGAPLAAAVRPSDGFAPARVLRGAVTVKRRQHGLDLLGAEDFG